jgi:Lar family restriction alleviation protein
MTSGNEFDSASQGPTDGPTQKPSVPPMALLPCPWCGVTESLEVYAVHTGEFDANEDERMIHYVACDRCGAEGPGWSKQESEAMAIDAWNTRAEGSNKQGVSHG